MRTETRYRQVAYEVYITSDGKEYTNKDDANHHEKELNGDIKKMFSLQWYWKIKCPLC